MAIEAGCTYGVGRSVLLLSGEATSSLSGVESSLASNNGLSLTGTGATGTGADLGGGIPILRHVCCSFVVKVVRKGIEVDEMKSRERAE